MAVTPKTEARPLPLAAYVRICLAFSFMLLSIWLLNAVAYPGFIDFSPATRDIAASTGAAFTLVLGFVSMRNQRLFARGWVLPLSILASLAGDALMLAAPSLQSSLAATLGACLHSCGYLVVTVYAGLALLKLPGAACMGVLIGAYLLKYVLVLAAGMVPFEARAAFMVLLPFVSSFLAWPFARPVLERVAQCDAPADLAITNPFSFLPLTHRLYFVTLLYAAFTGFVVVHGSMGGTPLTIGFTFILIAAVPLVQRVNRKAPIDALYGFAYVVVLAGLVLASRSTYNTAGLQLATNTLLQAGNDIFGIAIWFTVACIGARNVVGALPTLLGRLTAVSAGGELGVLAGYAINYLSAHRPEDTALFVAGMVFVFAAYNFYIGRRLSFDQVVQEVDEIPVPRADQIDAQEEGAARPFEKACAELAREYGLTAREAQVLDLLARGRNVAYIQAQLGLSRNTIRSYVSAIYGKLGVHSHQELIDLAEGRVR